MGAMDAVYAKVRLKDFYATDDGALLALAMAEVAYLRLPPENCDGNWSYEAIGVDFSHDDPQGDLLRARGVRDRMARHLEHSSTYWVSEEMANLTMHAAHSRESAPVTIEDFPHSHGFVFFDQPLLLELLDPDGRTETLSIKIFMWRLGTNLIGQPGVALTYWSQAGQTADRLGQHLQHTGQRPFHDVGPYVVAQEGFLPFDVEQDLNLWWQQFAATFVTLIDQEIPNLGEARVDKKMGRLARRAKINLDPVAVVTLRHKKADPNTVGSGRTLSVRYIRGIRTGGFWRTTHYGPGKTLTKKRWVMPHVVGNDDLPLVWRSDIVYRWSR